MTSRSSSWVNLIENNKRRVWQWCIAILLLVILSTVLLTLFLMSMDESRYIMDYGSRAMDMMRRDARKYCSAFMGSSGYRIIVTTILAALFGFGGHGNKITGDLNDLFYPGHIFTAYARNFRKGLF